ncbi:MAG: hypothetical protein ACFBWO_09700 [Paracoccaceae bacterium]
MRNGSRVGEIAEGRGLALAFLSGLAAGLGYVSLDRWDPYALLTPEVGLGLVGIGAVGAFLSVVARLPRLSDGHAGLLAMALGVAILGLDELRDEDWVGGPPAEERQMERKFERMLAPGVGTLDTAPVHGAIATAPRVG